MEPAPQRMAGRHTVKLQPVGVQLEAGEQETVLQAAFRQGITLAHGCKHGQCAACKSFVLAGEVELEPYSTFALADYELEEGYTLLCRAHAFSDLEVELLHYDPAMLTSGTPPRTLTTTVEQIQPLTHDIYHLRLVADGEEPLAFAPGQYVDIHVPGREGKRSFSMCNTPTGDGRLEFMIKRYPRGQFSGLLGGGLAVGDKLRVTGPYGVFTLRERSDADLIFIGGGSGMAPILSLLRSVAERRLQTKVTYYYGARTQRDLFYQRELERLPDHLPGFRFVASLSHPTAAEWGGEVGMITDVVDRLESDLSRCDGYVCGPPAMIDAAIAILLAHGLLEARIFSERFTITSDDDGRGREG